VSVVGGGVGGVVTEVIVHLRLPLAALLTERGAEVAELGAVAEVAVHELQLVAVDERIQGVHTPLKAELAAEAAKTADPSVAAHRDGGRTTDGAGGHRSVVCRRTQ